MNPSQRRALGTAASLLLFEGCATRAGRLPPVTPGGLHGRVVLLVNTASHCGYTPQLAGLQQLHTTYGPRGLAVVAAPCNDFGAQEPDAEAVLHALYTGAPHHVTFAITEKVRVVRGPGQHAAYAHVEAELGDAGAPSWNYHKLLYGRSGALVALFPPAVEPSAPELVSAIEAALAEEAAQPSEPAPPRR
jgi:glutathione peroxidase